MNYIYDLILNYNDNFYEFYDWNINDQIYEIRKIPIFKITTEELNEIKYNNICFDNDFINKIKNKTEYFVGRTIKLMTAFLLTDGFNIISLKIDKNLQYSSLQIDEELDVLDEINIKYSNIKYSVMGKKNINLYKTRLQIKQEKEIKNLLKKLFKENNAAKLKYIYYECFNKKEDNINNIISEFKSSTNNKQIILKLNDIFSSNKLTFN